MKKVILETNAALFFIVIVLKLLQKYYKFHCFFLSQNSNDPQDDLYTLISDDLESEYRNEEPFTNGNGLPKDCQNGDEINFNNSITPNQTSPIPPQTCYKSSREKSAERSEENNSNKYD